MRYMLDTNVCIAAMRTGSRKVLSQVRRSSIGDIGISSITLAELLYGAAKSQRRAHHEYRIVLFCAVLAIAPFDDGAAAVYGRVRADLDRVGKPIGPLDTLIAGHALALGATLVTANEREFNRIAELNVENWLK